MRAGHQPKTIRSYRLVFRRRWRIFRLQGWRIPLPGGLELRLLGYWLACLVASLLLSRLPLLGLLWRAFPLSLRLLALPLAAAWGLSRWEVDGRPPHRALAGLIVWRLRPRSLAGLRASLPPGADLAALPAVVIGPDLRSARYPRGELRGPARLLLRYPLRASRARSNRGNRLALRPVGGEQPLHRGKTLSIPEWTTVRFGEPR
jgi:hypothetical protein